MNQDPSELILSYKFSYPSVPFYHAHLLPQIQKPLKPSFKSVTSYRSTKNVICYFSNWAQIRSPPAKFVPENLDATLCSHIFYAYAELDSATFEAVPGDPMVDINDGYFNRVQNVAKKQNPQVKILLALGGWTDSTGDKYSRLVQDPKKRSNFVKSVTKMLVTRKFDGLSLEWQYPSCPNSDCSKGNPGDKQNFARLVTELKKAFRPKGLLLAAGLTGYEEIAKKAYDMKALSSNLDLVNVYAYDYHGYWDGKTDHHSPLQDSQGTYYADYIMKFYAKQGFSKDQLNLGKYSQSILKVS